MKKAMLILSVMLITIMSTTTVKAVPQSSQKAIIVSNEDPVFVALALETNELRNYVLKNFDAKPEATYASIRKLVNNAKLISMFPDWKNRLSKLKIGDCLGCGVGCLISQELCLRRNAPTGCYWAYVDCIRGCNRQLGCGIPIDWKNAPKEKN